MEIDCTVLRYPRWWAFSLMFNWDFLSPGGCSVSTVRGLNFHVYTLVHNIVPVKRTLVEIKFVMQYLYCVHCVQFEQFSGTHLIQFQNVSYESQNKTDV